tara:strand:- start:321 stop:650 length:330 start_codon:yes stop_codon:yes gene_type:complete
MQNQEEFLKSLSGRTTSHSHKFGDWQQKEPNGSDSVKQVTVLDAQWSDCPVEVEDEVKQIWTDFELGNDRYVYQTQMDDQLREEYPKVYLWLQHKGVKEGQEVWVYWWW